MALTTSPLRVQILLSEPTPIDTSLFLETARRLDPRLQGTRESRGFVLKSTEGGGRIALGDVKPVDLQRGSPLEAAFLQTWDWPEAEHALQHARASVVLSEVDTSGERLARVQRMCVAVRSLIEQAKPAAIHWETAQRLVEPQGFVAALAHGAGPIDYALNVRLFRIPDGHPGELAMDTLGLAPFALPDLQCHFAGAEPRAMGEILAGYAEYLFEKGDVLNDDSLVRGIQSHDEWAVHREESMILPAREVINILPDDLKVAH